MDRVNIHVWVNCICGAREQLLLPSLTARATCARCSRTYGVKRLTFSASARGVEEPLIAEVGYVMRREAFLSMSPVGKVS